ncbi:flagellar protein FlaG [Clostridium sp. MT-14]|uniref:Flagellar protein FlaG n=1 Tax=Clostridium aromativorans TaxID=2836848 RepID=A0ABS8N282_9CLOT|nr:MULTISPECIES: flagellar protein FlaG [Clostridium]KAA8678169.1 flagellar protein FlaG [Clostridium sp. HV4-5-A1G]MCC9293893.1 flagellar protein FlaG [Clostridium aromativorans]
MEVTGMGQGGQLPLKLSTGTSGTTAGVYNNEVSELLQNRTVQKVNQENITVKNAKDAADEANKIMNENQTHLKFEIYGRFKDIVVQVLDDDTNEVIKEVPPKKILDMVEKFCEMSGFFMDEKA